MVALVIPRDFSAALAAGKQTAVQVICDGSDANTSRLAMNYATAIAMIYSTNVTARQMAINGKTGFEPPVEMAPRSWYNPDLRSQNVIIPGIIGHVAGLGQPHIASDVGDDVMYLGGAELPDTRSELALPLQISSEQLMRAVRLFQPYREGPAQIKLEEQQITWRYAMNAARTLLMFQRLGGDFEFANFNNSCSSSSLFFRVFFVTSRYNNDGRGGGEG